MKQYKANMTQAPVKKPDIGVDTLHLCFKLDLEKDPVAGYALKNVPIKLETPMDKISWFGSIL